VTQDYYVAHVGPLEFSGAKFVTEYFTSRCSIAECLQYTPDKPSKIWLVPRPTGTAGGRPDARAGAGRVRAGRRLFALVIAGWGRGGAADFGPRSRLAPW
jgi:hypothetical protein